MASDDEKEKPKSIEVIEPSDEHDEPPDGSEDEAALRSVEDADGDGGEEHSPNDKESPKDAGKFKRFFRGYWRKKVWTIPLTILILAGLIFLIPATRYPVLAAAGMKRPFTVVVWDSKTNTTVSGAKVTLDGTTVTTDRVGSAKFTAKVGNGKLTVDKQYYQSFSGNIFVGISHTGTNARTVHLVATGRQVPIQVMNKISGIPVANAVVKVLDTSATTDSSGKAIIVLPTQSSNYKATITAPNYNDLTGSVQVTNNVVTANAFKMTPSGRIYFLSDQSGNIDVVSTNLDGTARKTVLAGTGNEDLNNTVLLASRDWKYLALLANRDGGANPKLYIIDTSNGNKLNTIDGGDDSISLSGWSNHNFVYDVIHNDVHQWKSGAEELETYNADSNKSSMIAESTGAGNSSSYINTRISFEQIVNDRVVYGVAWQASDSDYGRLLEGRKNSIFSVNADGSSKLDVRDIAIPNTPSGTLDYFTNTYFDSVVKDPGTLYIQSSLNSFSRNLNSYYIYSYDNNSADQSNLVSADIFDKAQQNQITYLASPSNNKTFWYSERDGQNAMFVGDYNGSNPKQIASSADLIPYGWYTDSYVLLEKGGSELYIMSPQPGAKALKISDYYKPPRSFYGYGGGYGGL